MGATLANAGVNPITKQRAIDQQYVKDVLSIMLTCGMYDYAGEWAYRVGLPAKSGVGGGICAVVPGRAGIGVFSPLLDARGNSVRGIKVCEELSERFGLHAFELGFDGERWTSSFGCGSNKCLSVRHAGSRVAAASPILRKPRRN